MPADDGSPLGSRDCVDGSQPIFDRLIAQGVLRFVELAMVCRQAAQAGHT
jgi:hypothetical protein